jgi:hypothetical protein
VALLDPAAFAAKAPTLGMTWHFRTEPGRLLALAAFPSPARYLFTAAMFGLAG